MKIVFVAFDCKKENSVMYKKYELTDLFTDIEGKLLSKDEIKYTQESILGSILLKAIEKGADFCSVRFVK